MTTNETREKVIRGLECCSNRSTCDENCPYWFIMNDPDMGIDECTSQLAKDALLLLKAQRPRVMTLEEAIETVSKEGGFVWIEEKSNPLSDPHIRPTNSIYDCPVRKFKDYGKEFVPKRNSLRNMWRCWTACPTEEQRKTVKWDDEPGSD